MRITPLDVRKQEFKRSMRGLDADEVRAFLTTLADEYEAVLVDNKQLRERVLEQDEKLAEYRNLEKTLRDTLMTAERVTQEARETARKEGEVLLQEARQKVEQTLAEGRARLDELRREALAVHREKEAYLGRFRSLAEAQIQFVEQHRTDFQELDGRLLERADALPPAGPATDQPTVAVDPGLVDDPAPGAAAEPDRWRDYSVQAAAPAAGGDQPPASGADGPPATGPDTASAEIADAVQRTGQEPAAAPPPAADPAPGADPAPASDPPAGQDAGPEGGPDRRPPDARADTPAPPATEDAHRA